MSQLIARYTTFPKLLFRLSNRPTIKLRELDPKRESGAYDVKTEHGVVQPIAKTSDTYQSKS